MKRKELGMLMNRVNLTHGYKTYNRDSKAWPHRLFGKYATSDENTDRNKAESRNWATNRLCSFLYYLRLDSSDRTNGENYQKKCHGTQRLC